MQDHFKFIFWFAVMLVLAALALSTFTLIHFGERYAEQIVTFWLYAGAAAGVQAVTGISISNMKKPPDQKQPGTTTAEISVTTTTEPKKEGADNE